MVNPKGRERRAHPRIAIDAPIGRDGGCSSYLKDISRVGAAAVVEKRIDEMSVVLVEARFGGGDLPELDIRDEAVVVRCDPMEDGRFEVGLFFHTMSQERRDEIDYFIERVSERSAPAV